MARKRDGWGASLCGWKRPVMPHHFFNWGMSKEDKKENVAGRLFAPYLAALRALWYCAHLSSRKPTWRPPARPHSLASRSSWQNTAASLSRIGSEPALVVINSKLTGPRRSAGPIITSKPLLLAVYGPSIVSFSPFCCALRKQGPWGRRVAQPLDLSANKMCTLVDSIPLDNLLHF